MRKFTFILAGQVVSRLGSGLTQFALGVWVFEQTGSSTLFALTLLFGTLPQILLLPVAGALVDRWDRRRTLVATDCASAALTLAVAVLVGGGHLAVWHVFAVNAAMGALGAFQGPALTAATATLVGREQIARASGLSEAGNAVALIGAPVLAGALVPVVGMAGVVAVDFATFFAAILTLLAVRFPSPASSGAGVPRRALLREATDGWRYLGTRPGLLALLVYFSVLNLHLNLAWALITPMILRSESAPVLGRVLSAASAGMVAGGLLLGFWGGPSRRVGGTLAGGLLFGACLAAAGLRSSPVLVGAALFGMMFSLPVINGCFRALWQQQTPAEMQGRVAATIQVVARCTVPLAFVGAGPLADAVFEPLLDTGGPLVATLGPVLGTGPGRGTGLLFVLMGSLSLAATLASWLVPAIRDVERPPSRGTGEASSPGGVHGAEGGFGAEPVVAGPGER